MGTAANEVFSDNWDDEDDTAVELGFLTSRRSADVICPDTIIGYGQDDTLIVDAFRLDDPKATCLELPVVR
jgi:hypothetical protein